MENSELKNKTFTNIIWRFGERFLAQFVSLIVSIVLARLLIPEDFGIIAIVMVFISIADVFVVNGLGASLVQKKNVDEIDYSTMFYSGILFSLCIYFILFLVAPLISRIYNNDLITPIIRVLGLRLPIAAINSVQQSYVIRNLIFKKFFFATLIGTVLSAVVGIYMAYNNFGVWSLVGQYMTNSIVDTFVLFLTISWKPKLVYNFDRFKQLFKFGWKVTVSGLIGQIFFQLKSLIIGYKYAPEDLAYSNQGEKIPLLISNNIESSIDSVLFSVLSKSQEDIYKVKQILKRFIELSSYMIIPMMLGLAAISSNLVPLLLTDKWIPAIPFLQIVCFQQIFSIFNTANLQAYKSIGRSDINLRLEFYKKPIFLLFIIIGMFISPLAITIGVALYEIVSIFINSFYMKKLINYGIKEQFLDFLPNLFIGIVMFAIVFSMNYIALNPFLLLFIQITVGFVVYLILSFIFCRSTFKYFIDLIKKNIFRK